MRRKLLITLAVIVVATGVYLTNFILFSHQLTPAELAQAVFTTPRLSPGQLYLLERRIQTADTVAIEQVYLDANNQIWIERKSLPQQTTTSELWLSSPTGILVDRYALTSTNQPTHTQLPRSAATQALFASAFYDWYLAQTQGGTQEVPRIARLTEWVGQVECYRVDWTISTGQATAWIAADNFRLVKEQVSTTVTSYNASIIAAESTPIALTLANWERYYNVESAD